MGIYASLTKFMHWSVITASIKAILIWTLCPPNSSPAGLIKFRETSTCAVLPLVPSGTLNDGAITNYSGFSKKNYFWCNIQCLTNVFTQSYTQNNVSPTSGWMLCLIHFRLLRVVPCASSKNVNLAFFFFSSEVFDRFLKYLRVLVFFIIIHWSSSVLIYW